MALAIDTIDGWGLSNEACRELIPKKSKVMLYFLLILRSVSVLKVDVLPGAGCEAYKRRLACSIIVRISA